MSHIKIVAIYSTSSRGLTAGSGANNYSPLRDSRLRGNDGEQVKHHGIGLLELMLALAIIAAVILLATRYFSQASEASKVTQATQIIHTLIDASFKWVEGKPNFGGDPDKHNPISMDQLTTGSGILPDDWKQKPSPWGGKDTITVDPYTSDSFIKINEPQNQIKITIPNVPESACKNLNDILEKQGIDTSLSTPCKSGDYIIFYPKNAN